LPVFTEQEGISQQCSQLIDIYGSHIINQKDSDC